MQPKTAAKKPSTKKPRAKRQPIVAPRELVLQRSDFWLCSAIYQGTRLMALVKSQTSAGDPSKWSASQRKAFLAANRMRKDHIVEDCEGWFFVSATSQVRRWVRRVEDPAPLRAAIAKFERATAGVSDIRDMREHEDAYLTGVGDYPKRYSVRFGGRGPMGFSTTAHAIVVRGDDYLLGGRVSVPKTLLALKVLQPLIEAERVFA